MKRKSGVLVEKLIEDPRFLDVEFMVHPHESGDCNDDACGIVVGSSVLLAAGSDYFSTLFNGQWREGQDGSLPHEADATKKRRRVDVHQASVEAFRQLLHFVYTGELPSEIQKAATLIKADKPGPFFEQAMLLWVLADRYGVVDVKPALEQSIRQFFAKQDMTTILEMTHNHEEVIELCEILDINFETLFRADQAYYSIPEHLEHIRVINELKATSSSSSKILDTALHLTHSRLLASPSYLLRFIEKTEFNALPFETVKLLFSLDLPLAEIQIFNAIDRWWQHDPANRTEQAESLTELVITDFLSYADLVKDVEPSELLDDHRLKEAFKFVAGHSRVSINERSGSTTMKTLNFSEAKCFLKLDATKKELSVSLWLAKSSPRKSISGDDVSLRVYFGRKLQPVEWPSEETSLSTTKPVEWTFDFQKEKHSNSFPTVTCFLCIT